MDPISTAIIAAAGTGVAGAASDIAKKAIIDAYEGLKTLIKRKFGGESELAQSIDNLEKNPESAGRKETLKEEVANSNAMQDPELVAAANAVLQKIKAQPGGEQHIQNAIGSYIAMADRGGQASVNVNLPKENQ